MTGRELLSEYIKSSGLKKTYIAEQLGITRAGLLLKIRGQHEFRESEIQKLCTLLKINKSARDKIFFAKKVD